MSLLTICQAFAQNVGIQSPAQVITSPLREMQEAAALSKDAADELARRVDFGALNRTVVLTGDGTDQAFGLGDDFSRITPGIGVTYGAQAVRPLTQAEWAYLPVTVSRPRYFILRGTVMHIWPYLGTGVQVRVNYQAKSWCSNGTANWAADTDTSVIDEGLVTKGLIVRWRRQKGMDYADFEAEYEAALADIARFDDRSRL